MSDEALPRSQAPSVATDSKRDRSTVKQNAPVEEPIFLVASERSGTTLLRLMLDGHPELSWHFEFEWAVEQIRPDGSFPPLREYHRWLETVRGFEDSRAVIDPSLDYAELVRSFLEQKRRRDNKPRVGATVHRHYDRLLLIWPNARFIHLLRDGRDVARSCVAMGWDGNAYCAADRWIESELLWEHIRADLDSSRYHEVRYEDLIADPSDTLTKICEFVGVEFDQRMFSYVETSTYNYPNPKLVYQWRKNSSDEEIRLLEAKLATFLEARSYELSGLPKTTVSPRRAKILKAQSQWLRRLYSVKYYGLPLMVAENLTRRLPGQFFHIQILKKMHEIERRHLK